MSDRAGIWTFVAAALWRLRAPAIPQQSAADTYIPLHAWVHDPSLASVALSPDGKHLVAVSLADMSATPTIGIWNADALAEAPTRFELTASDGSRWKPLSAFWLNDTVVYAVGRQLIDYSIGARKIKTFREKAFVYDMKKEADGALRRRRLPHRGSARLDHPG